LPKGSIDLNTIQKTEFKPYPVMERVKPVKILDNHKLSTDPFSVTTSYKSDFPFSEINSFAVKVKRNPNETS
jgi:hypothetical protein